MKKCILLLCLLLMLSACSKNVTDNSSEPSITIPQTTAPIAVESPLLPLPKEVTEFSFLSGAGAWRTYLRLESDGSFVGLFHDSEMGEMGDGYSKGSVYTCSFSGTFADIEKVSDYAYEMHLSDIQTERQQGEHWIDDEIRYVACGPYGLEEGEEFILYLPDTPLSEVPEAFLIWWPYRYDQDAVSRTTLSCYGILNTATDYGFFYTE